MLMIYIYVLWYILFIYTNPYFSFTKYNDLISAMQNPSGHHLDVASASIYLKLRQNTSQEQN